MKTYNVKGFEVSFKHYNGNSQMFFSKGNDIRSINISTNFSDFILDDDTEEEALLDATDYIEDIIATHLNTDFDSVKEIVEIEFKALISAKINDYFASK